MSETVKEPLVQSADRPEVPPELVFYTTKQVAALFETTVNTVKRWISPPTVLDANDVPLDPQPERVKLRAAKFGGYYKISMTDLREFAASGYGTEEWEDDDEF